MVPRTTGRWPVLVTGGLGVCSCGPAGVPLPGGMLAPGVITFVDRTCRSSSRVLLDRMEVFPTRSVQLLRRRGKRCLLPPVLGFPTLLTIKLDPSLLIAGPNSVRKATGRGFSSSTLLPGKVFRESWARTLRMRPCNASAASIPWARAFL